MDYSVTAVQDMIINMDTNIVMNITNIMGTLIRKKFNCRINIL